MTDDQTITILNDKAIELLEHDTLDFKPYVRALAKIVMSGSTALTIGMFGDWHAFLLAVLSAVRAATPAGQPTQDLPS